jgi:pimeloyl-ACP methyl ester carboxylesterase
MYVIVGFFLFLAAPMMIYTGAFAELKQSYHEGEAFRFRSRSGRWMHGYRQTVGSGRNVSLLVFSGNGGSMWSAVRLGASLASVYHEHGPGSASASESVPVAWQIHSMAYRGYDPDEGGPWPYGDMFEDDAVADALGLIDHVAAGGEAQDRVVLMGHSFGTAVATAAASAIQGDTGNGHAVACLILINPFTNMVAIALSRTLYFCAPWLYVVWDQWRTVERLRTLSLPALVYSAQEDEVIPAWMHSEVYEASTAADKRLLKTERAAHNDVTLQLSTNGEATERSLREWCISR